MHTTPPAGTSRQDQGIVLIALYHFVIGAIFVLATTVLAMPTLLLAFIGLVEAPPAFIGVVALALIATVVMIFAVVFLGTGYGLWQGRQWARVAAITLAVLALLIMPLGTVAGALILWHLLKPEIAERFN